MKTISLYKTQSNFIYALLIGCITCFEVLAQSEAPVETSKPTLNLDDQSITKEFVKKEPVVDQSEKLSVAPSPLDQSFVKAEKHGIIPTVKEINVPGTPERVTKVTGADGTSYCVYSPTVARTDGIDAIQNGLQNQVRTCPQ